MLIYRSWTSFRYSLWYSENQNSLLVSVGRCRNIAVCIGMYTAISLPRVFSWSELCVSVSNRTATTTIATFVCNTLWLCFVIFVVVVAMNVIFEYKWLPISVLMLNASRCFSLFLRGVGEMRLGKKGDFLKGGLTSFLLFSVWMWNEIECCFCQCWCYTNLERAGKEKKNNKKNTSNNYNDKYGNFVSVIEKSRTQPN